MFTFGLTSVITPDVPVAWGARAIDDGRSLGFLHDRQTWYVDGEPLCRESSEAQHDAVKLFGQILNHTFLKDIQLAFAAAKARRELQGGTAGEVVLLENWWIKCVANTNGSCGYVYLTVFQKPLPDLPLTQGAPTDAAIVWCNDARPAVGTTIWHCAWNRHVRVAGWAVEHGHLHMMVWCPTEGLSNCMGREWQRIVRVEDTAPEAIEALGLVCGDYITLPACGHDIKRPSRWVGISAGGSIWAKHWPDTRDSDVVNLASGLPEPQRTAAFKALGRPDGDFAEDEPTWAESEPCWATNA